MVTTFYPPYNFGGDGIAVQRLVHALANDGNEVHVIHDRDAYQFCSKTDSPLVAEASASKNITVHTLGHGERDTMDVIAAHQLGRPMKKRKELAKLLSADFDVIHFHNISLLGGPEILKMGNAVKFCTLHDHWFVCAMHILWRYDKEPCTQRTCLSCTLSGKRPPQLWRYTGAIEDATRHVNTFIAPSEFAKESHLRNGFPAEITVLPHFIPDEHLTEPAAEPEPAHARPYFLFAGRLEKLKGVHFLIEQFRNYAAADLIVAGTGTYENELKALAQGLNHVHFAGKVSTQRLQALTKNAIAQIVPSLCYETFGLVALEAFAQGTPAIVHDLGALPEVVHQGGGVTYKTAAELLAAMDKVRTEPAYRAQLVQEGMHNLKSNYTQQRHLSKYYDMISRLTGSMSKQEVG